MPYLSNGQKQTNTMMTGGNPLVAIGRMIVGAAAKPMTETDKNGAESVQSANKANQQGMQMSSAPNAPAQEHGILSEFGDSLLPGSERLIGKNAQPPPSVAGGFAIQPTQVDSSQQSGPSSGMQNYLNYMKYRGGGR